VKNKFFIIILVLILISALVGCSTEKPVENIVGTNSQQNTETAVENEKPNTEEIKLEEPIVQETTIDSSLEGIDLLNSISGEKPKKMKIKMDMSTMAMTTSSTVYYDDNNSRTESAVEGMGKNVLIYNADEEVMYSYVEGTGEGVRISGADVESVEEAGLMMDMSTKFSALTEEVSDDFIARLEKLGEEEVVYIETTEEDEEMGDILVKMWYSVKYNLPLKYEVIMGQQPLMSLNVVEIEKDIKIEKDMFVAPSDVNFRDVDMDAMIEMELE
jgi:outer membrane lipoprotein-sorting protein